MAAIPLLSIGTNIADQITFVACDGAGDTVASTSNTLIEIQNTDASAHQVTITAIETVLSCQGASAPLTNIVASVPAGESRVFKLSRQYYDAANNGVQIAYDDVTGMNIAAYE